MGILITRTRKTSASYHGPIVILEPAQAAAFLAWAAVGLWPCQSHDGVRGVPVGHWDRENDIPELMAPMWAVVPSRRDWDHREVPFAEAWDDQRPLEHDGIDGFSGAIEEHEFPGEAGPEHGAPREQGGVV